MESWSIKVHKDYLKFSAAHFLIFPDGTAERLHGHNYKVYVEVRSALDKFGLVLNFKDIKPAVYYERLKILRQRHGLENNSKVQLSLCQTYQLSGNSYFFIY